MFLPIVAGLGVSILGLCRRLYGWWPLRGANTSAAARFPVAFGGRLCIRVRLQSCRNRRTIDLGFSPCGEVVETDRLPDGITAWLPRTSNFDCHPGKAGGSPFPQLPRSSTPHTALRSWGGGQAKRSPGGAKQRGNCPGGAVRGRCDVQSFIDAIAPYAEPRPRYRPLAGAESSHSPLVECHPSDSPHRPIPSSFRLCPLGGSAGLEVG